MTTRMILVLAYSLAAALCAYGVLRHVTLAQRRRKAAWREWHRSSRTTDPSIEDAAR